jgi:hypothetical protein
MRQWQNYFWDNIFKIAGFGTNTKIIKTETLLWTWSFFIFLILFLFLFTFLFYFSQYFLCLCNACSTSHW